MEDINDLDIWIETMNKAVNNALNNNQKYHFKIPNRFMAVWPVEYIKSRIDYLWDDSATQIIYALTHAPEGKEYWIIVHDQEDTFVYDEDDENNNVCHGYDDPEQHIPIPVLIDDPSYPEVPNLGPLTL